MYTAVAAGFTAYDEGRNGNFGDSLVALNESALVTAGTVVVVKGAVSRTSSALPSGDEGAIRLGGGANDAPSWVAREAGMPLPGETAQQYAKRILDEKYGPGNWKTGGGSEFSKIVKWVTRGGRLS